MEELGVDFEVAQKISRKMLVDPDGMLHIFWGEGGKRDENILSDLNVAIRQGVHVIERYRGLVEKIGGEELILTGEAWQMSQLVGELQRIISRFLEPREISSIEAGEIRAEFERISKRIGQVSNEFKFRAKGRVITMPPFKDEQGIKNTKVPVRTGEAALDLLRRFDEINEKTWGTILRTRRLIEEKMRIERIIVTVYNSLGRLLKNFENGQVPDQQTLERIASQVVGNTANLMSGLITIKVQPYLGERIQSREIRRLGRLPVYIEQGRIDSFRRALEGAFLKLRPVVQEREARRIRRVTVSDKGQVKR